MKNKFLKSLFVGFVLFFASCEDYLDVNESPNNPLFENIDPTLTLGAALSQSARIISGDTRAVERSSVGGESTNALGNLMMNSWAGNVNTFTGVFPSEYLSNVTASFYDNIWDYTYTNVGNFQKIIDYKSTDFDNHKAIAKIMKSFYMQTIVDLYGDAPYSQAFKGTDNLSPAYDDDKAIYRGLLAEVDEAIALINGANAADKAALLEDSVMGGNMTRWVQFANTLKLRIIVRQSLLTDADSVAYVNAQAAILGALPASAFLQQDVTINPGFNSSNVDKQNPFYARYGYTIVGAEAGSRALITASKNAADALNANGGDPRRSRLFTVTAGNVVGIEQGANSGGTTPTVPSRLGPAIVPLPVGLDASIGSSQNAFIMTLSEVNFLISEAALRFPGAFASYDARTYFNAGITASFVRLSVGTTPALSTAAATTYITNFDGVTGYGWTGTANKIEVIMKQKWIALMNVTAGESWIDYVRTGFPATPVAITNTAGKPSRLLYPTSENSGNTANTPVQTTASAFASGPFWKI